ncbi:MAG: type II restriction endonuclease subunit M [Caulobacteraceae bacterium]|nr:type II restriction endonuclease subunit M [Caulobacteraceae bacterium]
MDAFIETWSRAAVRECSDGQTFIIQLCRVLGVPAPNDQVVGDPDYAFERYLRFRDEGAAPRRMRADCYRRGAFVLEIKGREQEMGKGLRQAEVYADRLERRPPFLVIVNVGRSIELWASFGSDRAPYQPFPDAESHRIALEDLRRPEIRDRLVRVWTDPASLDPTLQVRKVTAVVGRALAGLIPIIGARLAADLAAASGQAEIDPVHRQACQSKAANFLAQCILAMFADSTGRFEGRAFLKLLERYRRTPGEFHRAAAQLFREMRCGGFSVILGQAIPRFDSEVLDAAAPIALTAEDLDQLIAAARQDWRDVEPAVFGSLLEQAFTTGERAAGGVHYTDVATIEAVVTPTIMEVLRAEWAEVRAGAERRVHQGRTDLARQILCRFHRRLCTIRVLDPACGSGNFLYVAMRMMRVLEAEVFVALEDLTDNQGLAGVSMRRISRRRFMGLEIDPRAAWIARLVMTIADLQSEARRRGGAAVDRTSVVRACHGAIVQRDALLTPGRSPAGLYRRGSAPRLADWPEAEFIIGNPPYLGAAQARRQLGDAYVDDLWAVRQGRFRQADLVMCWWDRAARILARPGSRLRRFGFVTTNSIAQQGSRAVLEHHLQADAPIHLAYAVTGYPWGGGTAASVRVAITVAEKSRSGRVGRLSRIVAERRAADGTPVLSLEEARGVIGPDLQIGPDRTRVQPLRANALLASRGVQLMGAGFLVTPERAAELAALSEQGAPSPVRPYLNGRDAADRSRNLMVIDFSDLSEAEARRRHPGFYEHLLETVKPERDRNRRPLYRERWWMPGEPRRGLRAALTGLRRFIATAEVAKHLWFRFVDVAFVPDNRLVCVASDDAAVLGVLSSQAHRCWASAFGGRLEDRPVYVKGSCFDPFPFPELTPARRRTLAELAEDLDRTRQETLARLPALTMTGLYNLLARVRAGETLPPDAASTCAQARIRTLDRLQRQIDEVVEAAYGWPAGLDDAAVVERLSALNRQRVQDEARGLVRPLRPDWQAGGVEAAASEPDEPGVVHVLRPSPSPGPPPAPGRSGEPDPLSVVPLPSRRDAR